MLLFRLFENDPLLILPWLVALLVGITIHEFAHGFSAYLLGDETAYRLGRLSFNPLDHLDPIGSLMLLLVGFGWAKPVPININRVGKGNLGKFIVSFSGIFANLIIAIIFGIVLKIFLELGLFEVSNFLIKFFAFIIFINLALFVFNLLPIEPLDGFHILEAFAPRFVDKYAMFMHQWGTFILLFIVFFTNIISYLISYAVYFYSIIFQLNIYYLAFGGL